MHRLRHHRPFGPVGGRPPPPPDHPPRGAGLPTLPDRSPMVDRCLPPGASRICGTWADKPTGRRRNQRVRCVAEIGMRRMGSFSFQVVVEDVSAGGCKVELVEFVDVDDHVIARFPGIEPFSAKVSWADARFAGIDFERPLHPAVFEQLLSRLA